MINNFKVDFHKKIISFKPSLKMKYFTISQLYSYLQDLFDEPENMIYDIPIIAQSKKDFTLINGWKLNNQSLVYLKKI